jgi:uncharacterized RDD family membrane protein YckC
MENYPLNNKAALLCSECNREISEEELIRFGETIVCANCKPLYIQKLKEGVVKSELKQANFGVRTLALFIDSLIIILMFFICTFLHWPFLLSFYHLDWIIFLVLFFLYFPMFLFVKGATPGKLLLHLRVIKTDGSKLTFTRALARFFVQYFPIIVFMIVTLILIKKSINSGSSSIQVSDWIINTCILVFILINISAVFDKQGRALHDRICGTRVVMK